MSEYQKSQGPMFEFELLTCESDSTGYYLPAWGLAKSVTVRARTKDEAILKTNVLLGEPRRGWHHNYRVKSIREVPERGAADE